MIYKNVVIFVIVCIALTVISSLLVHYTNKHKYTHVKVLTVVLYVVILLAIIAAKIDW